MNGQEIKRLHREDKFISYLITIIDSSTAKAAALKRADNPALEYQSWEILNRFGIDLTHYQERLIFNLIAAAVAKEKIKKDGFLGIGAAIANCYENKAENNQATAKMRRLIACNSIEELCSVLRPLLQFISSKAANTLNYSRLLGELLRFQGDPLKIKATWAENFYYQKQNEEEENVC